MHVESDQDFAARLVALLDPDDGWGIPAEDAVGLALLMGGIASCPRNRSFGQVLEGAGFARGCLRAALGIPLVAQRTGFLRAPFGEVLQQVPPAGRRHWCALVARGASASPTLMLDPARLERWGREVLAPSIAGDREFPHDILLECLEDTEDEAERRDRQQILAEWREARRARPERARRLARVFEALVSGTTGNIPGGVWATVKLALSEGDFAFNPEFELTSRDVVSVLDHIASLSRAGYRQVLFRGRDGLLRIDGRGLKRKIDALISSSLARLVESSLPRPARDEDAARAQSIADPRSSAVPILDIVLIAAAVGDLVALRDQAAVEGPAGAAAFEYEFRRGVRNLLDEQARRRVTEREGLDHLLGLVGPGWCLDDPATQEAIVAAYGAPLPAFQKLRPAMRQRVAAILSQLRPAA